MQMPPRPRRVLKFMPSLVIIELWLWDLMLSCMLTGMGVITAEWDYSRGEHKARWSASCSRSTSRWVRTRSYSGQEN